MGSKIIDITTKRAYNYNVDVSGTWYTSSNASGQRRDWACDLVMLCRFESYRPHHFRHIERHCMKKLLLALAVISNMAFAEDGRVGNIDVGKNITGKSVVTWRYVTDVTAACNAERSKSGQPTFKQPSMACSIWTKDSCLIITARNTDADTLAHEVLHCFQGSWHK